MAKGQDQANTAAQSHWETEQALATRTKATQRITLLVCAALVLALGLALCFLPHEDYSATEKRTLAGPPAFSLEALLEGDLTRGISDFCADQFPLREALIQLKAKTELLLGKRQNNDVLRGKNGYLILRSEYTEADRANLLENLRSAAHMETSLQEIGIPFSFAVVPRSIDVNRSHLPTTYDPTNADAVWSWIERSDADPIFLTDALRQQADAGEDVWYKTDHHWTSLGAYYAYVALADELGYTPYALTDFEQTIVCSSFYGTAHASSGMHWSAGDDITLFRYEGDDLLQTRIVRDASEGDLTLEGLYDWSALQTEDAYNVFLGGTNTRIEVESTVEERPTLLLLKDSFSQSLAPFLARHFRLVLIDPRTFKTSPEHTLLDAIVQESPDRVLLLCGVQTLCEPNALRALRLGQLRAQEMHESQDVGTN